MKNLNLKNILYGIGLAGGALLVSGETGCETMNATDNAAVGLGILASAPQGINETPQQAIGRQFLLGVASGYTAEAGQRRFQQEQNQQLANGLNNIGQAIQNSQQTQVQPETIVVPENVMYINGNYKPAPGYTWINPGNHEGDFRVRKITLNEELFHNYFSGQDISFVCNYTKDFNNDGAYDSDEYVGIKNTFKKDEKITSILATHKNLEGKMVAKELIDSNGRTIEVKRESINPKFSVGCAIDFIIQPGDLPIGKYTISYSADKEYLGKVEFNITD